MNDIHEELGRSITQANRFLGQIYRDTAQLIAALDGLMAERGWQATERARNSMALSNGSNPKRWLLTYIFRWYVETADSNDFLRLVTFLIWFDPPPVFDQA